MFLEQATIFKPPGKIKIWEKQIQIFKILKSFLINDLQSFAACSEMLTSAAFHSLFYVNLDYLLIPVSLFWRQLHLLHIFVQC